MSDPQEIEESSTIGASEISITAAYPFFFLAQTTLLYTQNCFSRDTLRFLEELCKEQQVLVWGSHIEQDLTRQPMDDFTP
jgi:hypothetical protein